jgi:hypothetical protein
VSEVGNKFFIIFTEVYKAAHEALLTIVIKSNVILINLLHLKERTSF